MQIDDDDWWTDLGHKARKDFGRKPVIEIDVLEGVEPLDAQFGVTLPRTVPVTLQEPLFGQPADSGQDPDVLYTYAVLDAAKILGLPELLENTDLDHDCLFQGTAAEELRHAAPWIVKLEENNRFTRALFTKGSGPRDLWDSDPGIFCRSKHTLDDVRKHLRKFTKVRDGHGRWLYFRFWEGVPLRAYLDTVSLEHPASLSFYGTAERLLIDAVLTRDYAGRFVKHHCQAIPDTLESNASGRLTSVQEQALATAMEERRRAEIARAMQKGFPSETEGLPYEDLLRLVAESVHWAGVRGIRMVRHVHLIACWRLIYGSSIETRDPDGVFAALGQSPGDEGTKIKQMGARLSDLHKLGHL